MSLDDGPRWEPVAAPSQPSGPSPMRVGQVVEVAVRILRRHWPLMLLLALLFAGPGALLTSATGLRFTEVAMDLFPGIEDGVVDTEAVITQAELDRVVGAVVPYLGASLLAGLLLSIGALAFSAAVAADYHAREAKAGEVLGTCLRRTPAALGFMLVTSLVIAGIALLGLVAMSAAMIVLPTSSITAGGPGVFLALVAGVATVVALAYLTMRWAPAFPAMAEEGAGARAALRRSWHLSADNVWRIFVVVIFATLISALGGSVLAQLFSLLLTGALAPALGLDELVAEAVALALGSVILAPLGPVLTAVLYFDLRARRDPPSTGLTAADD